MKVSRKTRVARKPHPTHPELVFTLKKLGPFEKGAILRVLKKYERFLVVLGTDGEPMTVTENGIETVVTKRVLDVPADETLKISEKFLDSVEGLEDEDTGEQIPYGETTAEHVTYLKLLGTDDLVITLSPPRPIIGPDKKPVKNPDGTPIEQTLLSLYDWIIECACDNTTFESSGGKG